MDIIDIPIIKPALKKPKKKPRPKYTRSNTLRNIYKAKVNNITKKRGK
jgi:hypothetical protein|tara:strand:- start:160 stop:303 length:144 start_codon:yes stop_codon:yes gene_type:complete